MMNIQDRIFIYDDEFTWAQRYTMFEFIQQSRFIISGQDTRLLHEAASPNLPFLISEWNNEDILRFELLQNLANEDLLERMGEQKLYRCFVNLDAQREIHHVHTHAGDNVLLYQANLEWRPEWYGETFFYDDEHKDIIFANQYTPGRLIYFDGDTPHAFRPPSRVAPHFRFTVSFFFEKE